METSLDILRDKNTSTTEFRHAAMRLCDHLIERLKRDLGKKQIDPKKVVFAIILRSAIAFSDAAVRAFPESPVGVLGLKRDERTFYPHWYYENLPPISEKSTIVILDPMLATGGSAEAAVERLMKRGADPNSIYFVGIVAAPEGFCRLSLLIPKENITLASVDSRLDEHGMIVPGIGDFGDRYFGYVGRAIIA